MSTDYQPKIIFGIKFSEKQIMETIMMPINDCMCKKQNKSEDKYCSHCGKQLHRLIKKNVPKFSGFEDPENTDNLSIGDWPVAVDTGARNFYVGFYVKEGVYGDYGDTKCDFPDMSKMEKFKTDMKKLDLWDEGMFGVWVVLYMSC